MPALYIAFRADGTIERLRVEDKPVAYEHVVDDGRGTATLQPVPPEVTAAVQWAAGRLEAASSAYVRATLAKFAGVAPDKLDAAVAAVEEAKKA